jgi:hypothetical protein
MGFRTLVSLMPGGGRRAHVRNGSNPAATHDGPHGCAQRGQSPEYASAGSHLHRNRCALELVGSHLHPPVSEDAGDTILDRIIASQSRMLPIPTQPPARGLFGGVPMQGSGAFGLEHEASAS